MRPPTQNGALPPSCSRNTARAITTRPVSEVTMTARAEPVVEAPGDHGRDPGDEVRDDAEDHDLVRREAERDGGEDPAEGEDASESVAVDGARDEEPERRPVLAVEPRDVAHELTVRAEEAPHACRRSPAREARAR
jgi:hypothetical protein